MRKSIIGAFVVLVAFGALSCDEAKKMYVKGEVDIGTSTETFDFEGSLGKGGADNYGTCSYSDNKFSFEIGTSSLSSVSSSTELYLKVTGIQGPPIQGVYEDPAATTLEPKDDQEIAFGSVKVKNGANTFSFSQSDDEVNPDSCYFEMFAQAISGELTPDERQEFQYYVSLHCSGLSDVMSGDTALNSINASFYFANCE